MCNVRAGDERGALDSGVVLWSPEVFDQKVPFRMSNTTPCNVDFSALPFGWILCTCWRKGQFQGSSKGGSEWGKIMGQNTFLGNEEDFCHSYQ